MELCLIISHKITNSLSIKLIKLKEKFYSLIQKKKKQCHFIESGIFLDYGEINKVGADEGMVCVCLKSLRCILLKIVD